MSKLENLIEEIVDDCASKYRAKRVESLSDLTDEEQAPLFAAIIEDGYLPTSEWCFYDDLSEKELLARTAMLMLSKDKEILAPMLFRDQLKKIMKKSTATYINKLFNEAWEKAGEKRSEHYRESRNEPSAEEVFAIQLRKYSSIFRNG